MQFQWLRLALRQIGLRITLSTIQNHQNEHGEPNGKDSVAK
jgi:hypothetical protein